MGGKRPIYRYGHPAYKGKGLPDNRYGYRYSEDDTLVGIGGNKQCPKCNLSPKATGGHDPCIANLPGVFRACCGHGVKKGHIKFINGVVIKGDFSAITITVGKPYPGKEVRRERKMLKIGEDGP